MSKVQDLQLNTPWRVFTDANDTPDLSDVRFGLQDLGQIDSAKSFWCFWNCFGGEKALFSRLPHICNVRMLRKCVHPYTHYESPYLAYGGCWKVACSNEDLRKVTIILLMAAVSEFLGGNTVGIVFSKNSIHPSGNLRLSAEIWVSEYNAKDGEAIQSLVGYGICEEVIFKKFLDKVPLSKEIPKPTRIEVIKKYSIPQIRKFRDLADSKIVPKMLGKFNWSMLSEQTKNKVKTSQRDTKEYNELKKHFSDYFQFEIVQELTPPRKNLLAVESCPLSFKRFDPLYSKDFVVVRCKLLHCQHIIYHEYVTPERWKHLKQYHCTSFFDTIVAAANDPSMKPIPRDPPGSKRGCTVKLNVCHLLNSKPILHINWPKNSNNKTLSSLQDTRTGAQYLLIVFSTGENNKATEINENGYNGPYCFDISRGRIVVSVKDGKNTHTHDANFDLSGPNNSGSGNYKLCFRDSISGNKATLGFKKDPETKIIKFLFFRYDFAAPTKNPSNSVSNISLNAAHHVNIYGSPSMTMSPVASVNTAVHNINHGQTQRVSRDTSARGGHESHTSEYKVPPPSHSDSQRVCRTPPPVDPNTYSSQPYKHHLPSSYHSHHGYTPSHSSYGRSNPEYPPRHDAPPLQDHRAVEHYYAQKERSKRVHLDALDGHEAVHSPRYTSPAPPSRDRFVQQPTARRMNGSYGHFGGDAPFSLNASQSEEDTSNISHLIGRVVYLAKSESGSRFVQDKVTNGRYLKLFFQEMKKRVPELMTDNFGHYAVETLFAHCSSNQRVTLLQNLGPSLPNVACHKQGSFSVQSIINAVNTKEEISLLREFLKREVARVILSCPGHYVILRFISRFGWPHSDFIIDVLAVNVVSFATDHYGLRVMKAVFDAGQRGKLKKLFDAMVEHTNSLAENQYGNYIIQHVIDIGPKEVTDSVKHKMEGRYVRYAKQKFSSNVVEKVIKHSALEAANSQSNWTKTVVKELLASSKELISDKYGNYCLQTALDSIRDNDDLARRFLAIVTPHLEGLRVNVRQKWVKLLQNVGGGTQI